MKHFYIQHQSAILAEVFAVSPFVAVCGVEAEWAPIGSILVDLETGIVCASKGILTGEIASWNFAKHLEFTESTEQRRSVA